MMPITLNGDEELRLQLVEHNYKRSIRMAVYRRGFGIWVKMPSTVQVPVGLLGELRNRFSAVAA